MFWQSAIFESFYLLLQHYICNLANVGYSFTSLQGFHTEYCAIAIQYGTKIIIIKCHTILILCLCGNIHSDLICDDNKKAYISKLYPIWHYWYFLQLIFDAFIVWVFSLDGNLKKNNVVLFSCFAFFFCNLPKAHIGHWRHNTSGRSKHLICYCFYQQRQRTGTLSPPLPLLARVTD